MPGPPGVIGDPAVQRDPKEVGERRRRQDRGDRLQERRELVDRHDHAAEHQEPEEQAVRERERRLGPERAGEEQAEAANASVPRTTATTARIGDQPGAGRPAERDHGDGDEQRDLDELEHEERGELCATSRPQRGSGAPPSRFSTPYERS